MNSGIIIISLCHLLIILMLSLGVRQAVNELSKMRKCEGHVMGKVISVRRDPEHFKLKASYKYYPTFQYTVDGITYKSESSFSYQIKYRTVGGRIKIHYDLNNPEKYVAGEEGDWIDRIFLWTVGLISYVAFILYILLR